MGDLLLPMATLALLDDPLADWDWAFFPLMFLPVEILFKIMQCLTVSDRLRARVCRKLRDIENKEEYQLENLLISTPNFGHWFFYAPFEKMLLQSSWNIYFSGLQKIAKNNKISCIVYRINNNYGELFDFVSAMAASSIWIEIEDRQLRDQLLTNEAIEKLLKVEGRRGLSFCNEVHSLTSSVLLRIYQGVTSNELDLVRMNILQISSSVARSFLASLGLHVDRDGDFVSTNPHMEVHLSLFGQYIISMENMLIYVKTTIYEQGEPGDFNLRFYNSPDSVSTKLKELVDTHEAEPMDVYDEDEFDEEANKNNLMPCSKWKIQVLACRGQQANDAKDKEEED